MQRPTCGFLFALFVERFGDSQGVRINFDHAVDRRALFIDLLNSFQVLFSHVTRREFSGCHPRLQVGNAEFVEFERANPSGLHFIGTDFASAGESREQGTAGSGGKRASQKTPAAHAARTTF